MRTVKLFPSVKRQYFYPEIKRCPFCRQPLHLLRGLYLKKTIQTLDGALWVGGYATHCINPQCAYGDVHYLSKQLAALWVPGQGDPVAELPGRTRDVWVGKMG